jgi:hypothetical protein
MTMAYDPTIPKADQKIPDTRAPIQENFTRINEAFKADHVALNTDVVADLGKHATIRFAAQAAPPVFAATDRGFFSQVYTGVTDRQEIYAHISKGAGTVNIPFTASNISKNGAVATGTPGWSYLPSGLLMKWGHFIALGPADETAGGYAYECDPTAISGGPLFTRSLCVLVSPVSAADVVTVGIVYASPHWFIDTTTGEFKARFSHPGKRLNYIIIGV